MGFLFFRLLDSNLSPLDQFNYGIQAHYVLCVKTFIVVVVRELVKKIVTHFVQKNLANILKFSIRAWLYNVPINTDYIHLTCRQIKPRGRDLVPEKSRQPYQHMLINEFSLRLKTTKVSKR